MAELGEREMDWGERLSRLLAVSGEKPLLEVLDCGMETLAGIASGEVEVTPGMERLVEGLEVIYLGAVAWPEERAYDGVPGDGDAAGSGDDRPPPLVVAPMEDLGLDEVLETGPMGAALALSPGAWVGNESRSGLTSGRSSLVPAAVEATGGGAGRSTWMSGGGRSGRCGSWRRWCSTGWGQGTRRRWRCWGWWRRLS